MYLSCSCVMFLICKPTRRLSFRNKELRTFFKKRESVQQRGTRDVVKKFEASRIPKKDCLIDL